MNPWLWRSVGSAAVASAAALTVYLSFRCSSGPSPTFEDLLEISDLSALKPGGEGMTKALAEACGLEHDMDVLDIQCGSGESALLLGGSYGALVTGIDSSMESVETARGKAAAAGLENRLTFLQADPYRLPFKKESFDVIISEFVASSLDKKRGLSEWARVVEGGGCIGIHDVVWLQEPSAEVRKKAEITLGLVPETLTDWIDAFRRAGLVRTQAIDMTEHWTDYSLTAVRELGLSGIARTASKLASLYGANAIKILPALVKNEVYSRLSLLGYAIIVGFKP